MNVGEKIPQMDAVVIQLNGIDRDHRVARIDGLVRYLARTTAERNLRPRGRRQRQSQQNRAHSYRYAHCASLPRRDCHGRHHAPRNGAHHAERDAYVDSSRGKFR